MGGVAGAESLGDAVEVGLDGVCADAEGGPGGGAVVAAGDVVEDGRGGGAGGGGLGDGVEVGLDGVWADAGGGPGGGGVVAAGEVVEDLGFAVGGGALGGGEGHGSCLLGEFGLDGDGRLIGV